MKRCCANCKLRLNLMKLDYSQGGCKHIGMYGYICLGFADEGVANWMVGLDEDEDYCEMYTGRSK